MPARLGRIPIPRAPTAKAKGLAALSVSPANDPRTAEGQGAYIERQEALARQPDGTRVLFTNIDDDAAKRAEFWRLVEEHERDAEPDKISFVPARNPDYWARVAAHPECPPALAEKLADADPTKKISHASDGNVAMRRFLSGVEGWIEVGARRPDETPEQYKDRRTTAPAQFHDGRGGRVQYRIIGELPHELDVKGRAAILRDFSEEFARRKLPYVAVMHAPDHTNNDKNWHFHLVYYDRPCARVTADQVASVPSDPNPKNVLVEGVTDKHVGQWDFTVVERYRTSSREVRERRPFAQEKSKEVNRDQKWIETIREKLAQHTNNHLQEAGVDRRVDARRHEEMGIHNDPQEHLGTRLSNLEAMGVATPAGVANEERQWKAVLTKLDKDLEWRRNAADRQALKWLKAADGSEMAADEKRTFRGQVTRWHQHRIEAEEHDAIATNVDEHVDRLTSRATKVLQTCRKHVDAIAAGSATKFQATRARQMEAKAADAQEWLEKVAVQLKSEVAFAAETRAHAVVERKAADELETSIERTLADVSKRTGAKAAPVKEAANDQAARGDQARREATARDVAAWVQRIHEQRRRLRQNGRRVEPVDLTAEDRGMLASSQYKSVVVRLAAMRKAQDAVIADVVKEIAANPQAVVTQRARGGVRHILVGPRDALADAFDHFRDDPAIVEARTRALAEQARLAADREKAARAVPSREEKVEPRRPEAPAERVVADMPEDLRDRRPAPEPTPDRREADAAVARDRDEVSRRRALEEAIARAVIDGARRVVVAQGVARLSETDMRETGADAAAMASPTLQKRLAGIAAVQEREIRRVVGYARSNPFRLVERDGVATLSPRAPRELVEMADRWSRDPDVARQLTAIRTVGAERAPVADRTPASTTGPTPAPTRREPAPAEKASAPAPRRDAPDAERTATPASGRPDRAAAPAADRITDLVHDDALRAEARERARQRREEQDRAETRAAAEAARAAEARAADERVAKAVARSQATRGAHPLIDQWMALPGPEKAEERRQIAWRITSDRAAREKLRDIDRTIARRIRDESDIVRQERQPGLGLDLDRGQTPTRG